MQSLGAIEFRHLRYFMRVAQELHFGRAAEMLGCFPGAPQPADSPAGTAAWRSPVRPHHPQCDTHARRPVLFEKAQQVLVSLEEGIRETQAAGGLSSGRLRIAAVYVGLYNFMSKAMREFSRRNPSVLIDMQIHTTEEQLALLKDRKVDVAFVRPPRTASGIAYREIYREGFVAVLPAESHLASRENLEVEDLRDENFITYSSIVGVSYQDVVLQHCRKAGFVPKVVQEVSHTMTVVAMASAGIGVGIVRPGLS